MALPESFLLDLKQNNRIEDVIGSYTVLKRSGRNYMCCCPLHNEKTPSCSVSPEKGLFHCFGCGLGGDVITFMMKKEDLPYIEAVRALADRAGMKMPDSDETDRTSQLRIRILELNRMAARYFYDTLISSPEGEKGRRYFASRRLQRNIINRYGLGYAPDDWHRLKNYMNRLGYTDEELITANLCTKGRSGKIFDSFRDRVMFPIIDVRGNVVAFGGRIIDGSGPKYLNSSDTPVFKKSRNLFSLNLAKKSEERTLILAEGYMDVIAINQGGFPNVVATLGTSLTEEQARIMKQYADKIIIAYDSDGPGQAAAHRAINILSEAGLEPRILKMEGAKDPDEYIKNFGAERFRQLLNKSDEAISFEMTRCAEGLDINSESGKIAYIKRCIQLFADINSPLEREVYIGRLAEQCSVSKSMLLEQVNSLIVNKKSKLEKQKNRDVITFSAERRNNPESIRHPKEYRAECGIIAYLAGKPEELPYIEQKMRNIQFVTEFNKIVFEKLTNRIKNSVEFDISFLQSEFSADEMGKIYEIIVDFEGITIGKDVLDDYINVLAEYGKDNCDLSSMSPEEFKRKFEKKKGSQ